LMVLDPLSILYLVIKPTRKFALSSAHARKIL